MSNSKHDIFEGPRSTLAQAFGEVCMREAAEKPCDNRLIVSPAMAKAWQDEYGYLPDDVLVDEPIQDNTPNAVRYVFTDTKIHVI